MTISVVIPVYNSVALLPRLVTRLRPVLVSLTSCYELILVNDGSQDDSWNVIKQLVKSNAWITGIDLLRNYGQHNATLAGLRAARYETIVTMDDDLQHSPEEIPRLLAKLEEGYDVVYGVPIQEQHSLWRILAARFVKRLLRRVLRVEIAYSITPFRVLHSYVCNAFTDYQSPYVSIDVLLSWGTAKFAAVLTHHGQQIISRYTVMKSLGHAIKMIIGFGPLSWMMRLAKRPPYEVVRIERSC